MKKTVAVVGLGYVGLPLLLKFSKSKNYSAIGIDTNLKKINFLKAGKSYLSNIKSHVIRKSKNFFDITNDFSLLKKANIIIYTLPTPITENKDPDMSFIQQAINMSKKFYSKNQLIILESTVYPGATEEYFDRIIKELGFKVGINFFLGFSPEREDPGNKDFNISNIIKLVSGKTKKCLLKTNQVYRNLGIKTKMMSSIKSAEITKLYENIYRSVNIGLANEMKVLTNKMNLDINEVINSAKTKPFGFQAFYPGPGLGGHCIPVDPYLLSWSAKKYDFNTRFIELSAEINNSMPHYVIEKISSGLNLLNKNFNKSKILVLGVAYKKDINDYRESPAIKIIKILIDKGAEVFYHDKYVDSFKLECKSTKKVKIFLSNKLNKNFLKKIDLVCLVTDHNYINYGMVEKNSKIIVDCRGKYKLKKNIIKA